MTAWQRVRRVVLGAPKDVKEPHAFHKLSLVAFLAWVGLGADGLSSSAYGPDEAFRQLGEHVGLAVFLALATALTVFIISYGYSRIIEQFPSGGGGYVVASKLLGPRVGRRLGLRAARRLRPDDHHLDRGRRRRDLQLPARRAGSPYELACSRSPASSLLTLMNLRGVKESVTAIAPIFVLFLVTHAILLLVGDRRPRAAAAGGRWRGARERRRHGLGARRRSGR